jgi:2-polyprenyl-6-methoxyphenol hydroxylase-like FAD-dependent oxidoreductase
VIVIGGGLAGLATALFLGSDGHEVTLFEADPPPPDDHDADAAFAKWQRRGAGQARQSHMFLGRSSAELARVAPDVFDLLDEAGALRFDDPAMVDHDGTSAPLIGTRRFAYELALRRAIERRPTVKISSSTIVTGLLSADGQPPRITGVLLTNGEEHRADLVVDCAGRRSMAHKWLVQAGTLPVPEQRQACGFTYLTRWYRLREGQTFPDIVPPASVRLPYMSVIACPADRSWFSITLGLSEKEPFRRELRDGERFDRIVRAVPVSAPFVKRAMAASEPLPFGNIANQRRSLVDAHGPLVRGYVLTGDSSMHTNPTLGRGTSLAFAQARHLASSLQSTEAASADLVLGEEQWASKELGVWFNSQVAADAALADRFDRLATGRPLAEPDQASRVRGALLVAAGEEPAVAREVRRMANLLITPAELMSQAVVARAISERVSSDLILPEYVDALPRGEFERLLTSPIA